MKPFILKQNARETARVVELRGEEVAMVAGGGIGPGCRVIKGSALTNCGAGKPFDLNM